LDRVEGAQGVGVGPPKGRKDLIEMRKRKKTNGRRKCKANFIELRWRGIPRPKEKARLQGVRFIRNLERARVRINAP